MTWQIALVLLLTIPVLLIPVVFVWYLNLGGIYAAVKEARAGRVALKKGGTTEPPVAGATAPEQKEKSDLPVFPRRTIIRPERRNHR